MTEGIEGVEAAEAAGPAYRAGDIIEAQDELESWYVAKILSVSSEGQYRVHYAGWPESSDEDMAEDRIRSIEGDAQAQYDALETPGRAVSNISDVPAGTDVWARWGGRWFEASVSEALDGTRVRINYNSDGSDAEVEATQIRLR